MIYRIEIGLKDGVPDARGRGVIHRAEGALKMDDCGMPHARCL